MKKIALGFLILCFAVPIVLDAKHEGQFSTGAAGTSNCVSGLPSSLSLKCVWSSGHLYAIAEIDLRSQKIVFTTSDDRQRKTFPEVFSNLSRQGITPVLLTNAGIYGTDNRPLGLLISPKGKLRDANTRTDMGSGAGNFSWYSAVFQISDEDRASIVRARDWRGSPHIVAGTQSGPELASMGKINPGLPVRSEWSYRRTAVGVDQTNRRIVYLVVSRDPVTLYDLATLMVGNLHCSEALHLDGDLSAFYLPSAPKKFLFSDPGERIVTALSVIDK